MTLDRPWPAMIALAAALLLWSPPAALAGHRLRALLPAAPAAVRASGLGSGPTGLRGRLLLAAAGGVAVGLLLGGTTGVVVAVAATVGGERLLRAAGGDDGAAERGALARELPVACDLLGVCLTAGMPVGGALTAVAEALPAPMGPRLGSVAALYRLGADPRRAWAEVPAELAALGRILVRAGESGSAVVPALRSLAADSRAAASATAQASVQRAGVWVLAPLGACFLPAFVCLGVLPLVLGIAGDVFG